MSFTAANARALGSVGGKLAAASRRASTRNQILQLKAVALRDAIDDSTPVGVRASLMRAYVDLQEIDMALRGVGKPKPVEAKNANERKRVKENAAPIAAQTPAKAVNEAS